MVTYYQKIDGKLQSASDSSAPWIHVTSPLDNAELEDLSKTEDIPLDFLLDSLDIDERSRYEREDEIRLIVINAPVINTDEKESDALYITAPIGIIMKADKTITICSIENEVIDRFLQQRVKNFDPADQRRFVLQIFLHAQFFE